MRLKGWMLILIGLLPVFRSSAQDSVAFVGDFRLYEGLYMTYQDLRYNWPIPKEKIITKINKDQLDFYSKLMEQNEIQYYERDSSIRKMPTEKVYGYCQNNVVFLNYDRDFYRIPVFGSICYFIGTAEVINYSPGYSYFNSSPITSTNFRTREIKQLLFDFYTGDISAFTIEKAEEYLKRDPEVFKEYDVLSKKKKKELIAHYIRMYNDKHLVYFPKG